MERIHIVKKSVTKLDVDCVVNAANEGLWAGGGVCGAIFKEAGYNELTDACTKIGHCDTGNAVITPGFQLKAKYIIHAVGPQWPMVAVIIKNICFENAIKRHCF